MVPMRHSIQDDMDESQERLARLRSRHSEMIGQPVVTILVGDNDMGSSQSRDGG